MSNIFFKWYTIPNFFNYLFAFLLSILFSELVTDPDEQLDDETFNIN